MLRSVHSSWGGSETDEAIWATTQQRNHNRRNKQGKTPQEASESRKRPEDERSSVEKIAQRLDRVITCVDEKWAIVKKARDLFPNLSLDDEDKMKRIIRSYTTLALIEA